MRRTQEEIEALQWEKTVDLVREQRDPNEYDNPEYIFGETEDEYFYVHELELP